MSLDNTTSNSPIFHSDEETTIISKWGCDDQNISLGSLEIRTEVWRGGFGCIGNGVIGMNPSGTIRGNCPQGTKSGSFEIFESLRGVYYFSHRSSLLCHVSEISENPGCDIMFKNTGHKLFLKLKKMGTKILKFSFNLTTPTQITPTRITPTLIMMTWQTSSQKINMIWTTIIRYTKWCHRTQIIHKL